MSIKKVFIFLIALVLIGGAFYYYRQNGNQNKNPVSVKKVETAAMESKGLREFAANTDAKDLGASPRDKAMYQEVMDDLKLGGDGKDKSQNQKAIDAISTTIKKYPSFSQLYFLRVTLSLAAGSADYKSIASDIDNALKYRSATDPFAPSLAGIYGTKAKLDFERGDYEATLTDLDTVLKSDPSSPNEAINTGATKPEEISNPAVLNLNDYNTLIKQFPNDPRTYMYRGLFYSLFTLFDEHNYILAANDYKKAVSLNSHSALAYYLIGELYTKSTFFTKDAASDVSDITHATGGFRDKQRTTALEYFKQSIAGDSNFKYGYAGAAETLFALKRTSEAIPYYDKVIELDPNNAGAYNDRGLAKTDINDYYGASSDFSKAIEIKTSQKADATHLGMSYENRAAAYVKVMNYERAIDDYGTAIGLKFAAQVLLMSLPQIRDLYPEFANLSDQVLLEGLRQKYFPNMSSADFVDNYKHDPVNKDEEKKPLKEFVLGDLYTSRGDVYVLSGHFKNAAKDYSRAIYEGSTSISDRWRLLSKAPGTEYYLDAQTLNFSPGDISIWIKILDTRRHSYSQQNYKIDCSARKLQLAAESNYNSLGDVINTHPSEQNWQSVVPDTFGEILYKGMCS